MRSWKGLSGNKQMTGLLEPWKEITKSIKTNSLEESQQPIHMTSSTGAKKQMVLTATVILVMVSIVIVHHKATNVHAPQTTGTQTGKLETCAMITMGTTAMANT
jgi:hypothetical protein